MVDWFCKSSANENQKLYLNIQRIEIDFTVFLFISRYKMNYLVMIFVYKVFFDGYVKMRYKIYEN